MDAKVVREWARSQGMAVGKRGRLSGDIFEAFSKAQSTVEVAV